MEIKAIVKIIRDSENLNYLFANIGGDFVQIPMAALFGDQLPVNIVFPEDEPNEEIEEDQFYAVGANGTYDNFIEGTICHAGGRWYKRLTAWEYKEPYWWSNATAQSADWVEMAASEELTAPCLVNIWDDEGTPKMRKASNTAKAFEAMGFIKNNVAADAIGKFYFGGIIPGLTGLTIGKQYFLGVDGTVVDETGLPSAGESFVQKIGKAISSTTIDFKPEQIIILAA